MADTLDNFDFSLTVPHFARISDYAGLWCIEESFYLNLCKLLSTVDLSAHVEKESEPLKIAMDKMSGPGGQSIALVRLTGLMMKSQSSLGGTSTIAARRELRQATADPEVGGIIVGIDSPGGTVNGTAELGADIKAAASLKPTWAHIEDTGASAAYWAAANTSRILANAPTAQIGSIGTYQVMQDMSAAAEKAGVQIRVFSTGPLKGMGIPGTRITDDQAAHMQYIVNGVQKSFDSVVMRGRGMNQEQLASVRHGGSMLAPEAMQSRLIDGIQPLSQTMQEMMDEMKRRMKKSGGMPYAAAKLDKSQNLLPIARRVLPARAS